MYRRLKPAADQLWAGLGIYNIGSENAEAVCKGGGAEFCRALRDKIKPA